MNTSRIASLTLSLFACATATAATLQALPQTSPQTTCPYCFFAETPAVAVRDALGNPLAGVPVTFSIPANAFVPERSAPHTVVSDSNGIASMPYPGLVAATAGAFAVTASAPGTDAPATFDLNVAGAAPSWLGLSTRTPESGVIGLMYPNNFVVRVFDADNQPIANAAVRFTAPATGPSGTFPGGSLNGYSRASSTGYAGSPTFVANYIIGFGEVRMTLLVPGNDSAAKVEIVNSAPGAASIEPLGAVSQSTRVTAFFPQAIGARVRDANGNPLKDVAVRFDAPYREVGGGFFVTEDNVWNPPVVLTGADGTAWPAARVLAMTVGTLDVTASVPWLQPVARFDFVSLPGGARTFQPVSGLNQRAIVNQAYKLPWVMRVVGAGGQPIPFAAARIFTDGVDTHANVSFGGRTFAVMMADADGYVTSPQFTANGVVGHGEVVAYGFVEGTNPVPYMYLGFENLPQPQYQVQGSFGPNTLGLGEASVGRFTVALVDGQGNYPQGVHFTYSVDGTCAMFLDGTTTFTGVTDSGGAVSPPLYGLALSSSCEVTFTADGLALPLGFTMRIFRPEDVVLTATQASIEVATGSLYTLAVTASVDGLPVNIAPGTIIGASSSGATATLQALSLGGANTGYYSARFLANDRPGTYEVTATYRQARATTAVKQKPR